jgi:ABC-2 type transport system ATP-binding protein
MVEREDAATLIVSDLDSAEIGRIAAIDGVPLIELTPRSQSLEEAFMALTRESVEFGVER